MALSTRRSFLKTGAAVSAYALMATRRGMALPFGLPLGLQLYSVRQELPKDYAGTLKKVAALGYRDVEAAGFYEHSAAEVKQAMSDAGLHCVSAHYPSAQLSTKLDEIIDFHKTLGAQYIVCSSPGHRNPPAQGSSDPRAAADSFGLLTGPMGEPGAALVYELSHSSEARASARRPCRRPGDSTGSTPPVYAAHSRNRWSALPDPALWPTRHGLPRCCRPCSMWQCRTTSSAARNGDIRRT